MQHIIHPLHGLIISAIRQDIRNHDKLQSIQILLDGFRGFDLVGFVLGADSGAYAIARLKSEGDGAEAEMAGATCYEDDGVVGCHCERCRLRFGM